MTSANDNPRVDEFARSFERMRLTRAMLFCLGLGLQLGIIFALMSVWFYMREQHHAGARERECSQAYNSWNQGTEVNKSHN